MTKKRDSYKLCTGNQNTCIYIYIYIYIYIKTHFEKDQLLSDNYLKIRQRQRNRRLSKTIWRKVDSICMLGNSTVTHILNVLTAVKPDENLRLGSIFVWEIIRVKMDSRNI